MSPHISRYRPVRLLLPWMLSGLVACSGTGIFAPDEDPRMAQLSTGMEQCLAAQQEMKLQIETQQQQTQQSLQDLSNVVASAVEVMPRDRGASPQAAPDVYEQPDKVCAPEVVATGDILLVGELEQVWLQNLQLALPARIDTGAETASLDARNIEIFERDGRRWVRFEILHPETGEPLSMERRLKRMVSILQASTTEPERRPVIKLDLTIGHVSQTAEFTLSDRSHLDYQVLIGRNILQDVMVVDVSKKNIAPLHIPVAEQALQ